MFLMSIIFLVHYFHRAVPVLILYLLTFGNLSESILYTTKRKSHVTTLQFQLQEICRGLHTTGNHGGLPLQFQLPEIPRRFIAQRRVLQYAVKYCITFCLTGLSVLFVSGCTTTKKDLSHKENVMNVSVVSIPSSLDGVMQKMKYLKADGEKRPLLVALHTWSYGYEQDAANEYFARCRERDWNCIFPDFRGANNNPEAGGSEAALQDILDSVSWATDNMNIDHRRIFLAGASGGGHMALLSAGNSPSAWTAVSAWVPISDLARWHKESTDRGLNYYADVENICGGAPGSSPEVDKEYSKRSPITSIWRANIIPLDINAGIHDGHAGKGGEGSVPVGHSIRAFNELAKAAGNKADCIAEDMIGYIETNERIPGELQAKSTDDPVYGRTIHLRRTSSLSRLTLFEGGHEILYDAVFTWFESF